MNLIMEVKVDLFLSTFETGIDRKGRVSIPARFRSLLERKKEELVLFTVPENAFIQGCGEQYIERIWETNLDLDQLSDEAQYLQDILSDALHVKLDSEGRILLPQKLINSANLIDNVLFAGKGETFQIWNPETYFYEKDLRNKKRAGKGISSLTLSRKGK